MKRLVFCFIMAATIACMASCEGKNGEKQAEGWLKQAQSMAEKGEYTKAAAAIDSLRKNCPKAIEARKTALKLYQQMSLKAAQQTVESADKALQAVNSAYTKMQAAVNELRERGEATAEQFTSLTLLRMKRDSIQTVFDVECAKIKYIKAKMRE